MERRSFLASLGTGLALTTASGAGALGAVRPCLSGTAGAPPDG